MPFPFDEYPWVKFEDLNLAYMIRRLGLIISAADTKLEELDTWKTATEQDLENWKNSTMDAIDAWQDDFMADVNQWEHDTEEDLAQWKVDTLAALDTWKTATTAVFEQIRVQAAGSASAASASASQAETARAGAVSAQTAAEQAAANISAEAAQIQTNTDDIADLKNAVENYNAFDLLAEDGDFTDELNHGIQFTFDGKNKATAMGSNTETALHRIFSSNNSFPSDIVAGGTYYVHCESTDPNFRFQIYPFIGTTLGSVLFTNTFVDGTITIPSDATGLLVRLYVPAGTSNLNASIKFDVTNTLSNEKIVENIDDIKNNLGLESTNTAADRTAEILSVLTAKKYCKLGTGDFYIRNLQMPENAMLQGSGPSTRLVVLSGEDSYGIALNSDTSVEDLTILGSLTPITPSLAMHGILSDYGTFTDGTSYGVSYAFNSEKTIATVSGRSTGTSVNRMYNATNALPTGMEAGGTYFVHCKTSDDNIRLQIYPYINGSLGSVLFNNTFEDGTITLPANTTGLMIRLYVANGNTANGTIEFSLGTYGRTGIKCVGSGDPPANYSVENVTIKDFAYSGILLENTGAETRQGLFSDIFVQRCGIGMNILYSSEYHNIANSKFVNNYIGMLNNGGNNKIVNCGFDANTNTGYAMVQIDGYNNSHGSVANCTFNHTRYNGVANSGYAIVVYGMTNGEVFSGCNVFFGKVYIRQSNGIIFDGCTFGILNAINPITVRYSTATLIANSTFQGAPEITQEGNTGLYINNCYDRLTGNAIAA